MDDQTAASTPSTQPEEAVLGAMLNSYSFAFYATHRLASTDFSTEPHQLIFGGIAAVATAASPEGAAAGSFDVVAVMEHLRREQRLEDIGGALVLHHLAETAPDFTVAEHCLEIVWHTAVVRGRRPPSSASVRSLNEALRDSLDAIERLHNDQLELTGVPTGFPELDRLTGGLQPGQLTVVASRPGVGKSVLGLNMARHAALRASVPTLVCTLESSRAELTQRLMCAECTVDMQRLRTGRMEEADWMRLTKQLGALADAPLWIDDRPVSAVGGIRAAASLAKAQFGLGLLVVDPLQAVQPDRPAPTLYEQTTLAARGLKALARDLDIPLVAVAQVSRGPEARADRRPLLSDLRDSGALEDIADVIIFVYRDELYDWESPRRGEADLIVAKHRHGPVDTVTVAFQGQYVRFAPIAPRPRLVDPAQ